ncbi:NUDIX hydrolase [Streptomyces fuscigenes]|uniref:NUDIX hydrolase n=1 Tax=Streptomyces fuscigenes TaxID=1528880 RepID=UPI001F458C49|nr:NUDIX hydrolase [Streptomyces fuscigenes]MCF3965509.1 NUDIX hydrolase [Streptomyces fuscigenes]
MTVPDDRSPSDTIRAGGCLLWRRAVAGSGSDAPAGGGDAIELCLVHRPAYDDWSHPKGKLKPGESALAGALREVLEETGHYCVPGAALGTVGYEVEGRPKTVEYWAAEESGGAFTPSREVDRILWLSPAAARERLTEPRDRLLVDGLVAAVRGARPDAG